MRFYKSLLEGKIDTMSREELLADIAKITAMLPSLNDEARTRAEALIQRLTQAANREVPWVSPVWGIKLRTIDHLVELLEQLNDPKNNYAQESADQIKQLDEEGLVDNAPMILNFIEGISSRDEYRMYHGYDYSELVKFLEGLVENRDIIDNDHIVRTANDFNQAINATWGFGLFPATDEAMLRATWGQVRSVQELFEIDQYFGGELDDEGRGLIEASFEEITIPKDRMAYVYNELRRLQITHLLPNYYYRPLRSMSGQADGEGEMTTEFQGLPDYDEILDMGYEKAGTYLQFTGNSGYGVDEKGNLNRATRSSQVNDSKEFTFNEATYDGDEFFEHFGTMYWNEDKIDEAEYQGRKVKLGKPTQGDVKKFKVYVRNPKGNVVKVNFGDPDMRIRKSDPDARRSFRARHNCDNPGPRHKARYWSCRKW